MEFGFGGFCIDPTPLAEGGRYCARVTRERRSSRVMRTLKSNGAAISASVGRKPRRPTAREPGPWNGVSGIAGHADAPGRQ